MYPKEIRIEDYRYNLPEERIAKYPKEERDQSKLLIYKKDQISHTLFSNVIEYLPPDSTLIWNDTKVIPARLQFQKTTGALIEIFLLEPVDPALYGTIFNRNETCEWLAIIGNQKKWKGEPLTKVVEYESVKISLSAEYADQTDKSRILLRWSPGTFTFARILDIFGKTPIPPYIKRESEENDKTRYQTVYANFDGSVAAPTAGLHFTEELINEIKQKNIHFDSLTLHVGSGTFVPVKSEIIGDHHMHSETVIIKKSTIDNLLLLDQGQLTVVGTTSLRSLESLYWLGRKISVHPDLDPDQLSVDQWEPYFEMPVIPVKASLRAIIDYLKINHLEQIRFNTRLIIVPGYSFKLVNRLITNFHQPSSTLLLLVSALVGEKWRDIYEYAIANDFRFLSYGDSSLLENQFLNHG